MEIPKMLREEFGRRLTLFQERLCDRGLDGALLFQAADLFYLTGTAQEAHLFVPQAGEPCLLVYQDEARARRETVWDTVIPLANFREIPLHLADLGYRRLLRLGTEMDVISWKLFSRYRQVFPEVQWEDISGELRSLRMVKSEPELAALRHSAAQHKEVFQYIEEKIVPGMTELEIAADLEGYARRRGHQGRVRYRGYEQGLPIGLVAAGPHAAYAAGYPWTLTGRGLSALYPLGAGTRVWQAGEPLLIDYAGVYGDYLVDKTKVYFAGSTPAELLRAQKVAEEIAALVAERARPGVTAGELYDLAVRKAREAGLGEHFMGWGKQAAYIGHGVGLELNEWPVLARGDRTVLAAGMVIAIEPKFVFPGQGAVGLEETYVVTPQGARPLA
ncbi:M24 family metallopeptidase [Thermanaeromonas sp. C210]|uniref:M24 family metallopeptidase n=1 Tax=Thermanaeromonas sp. C210 TaxID=2731925 RepID=UPI00155B7A32|nr:Xaa-Pro peptidase family protein [Thermanaeromonas sp. C210]GFN23090.1 peptidase M24 [Thermanaeromonas sp. C210]